MTYFYSTKCDFVLCNLLPRGSKPHRQKNPVYLFPLNFVIPEGQRECAQVEGSSLHRVIGSLFKDATNARRLQVKSLCKVKTIVPRHKTAKTVYTRSINCVLAFFLSPPPPVLITPSPCRHALGSNGIALGYSVVSCQLIWKWLKPTSSMLPDQLPFPSHSRGGNQTAATDREERGFRRIYAFGPRTRRWTWAPRRHQEWFVKG